MKYKSPVYNVIAVLIEKVRSNNYNPNKVAPSEMRLLYENIKEDGYVMPVVCYHTKVQDIYLAIDGFHRYRVVLNHPDIYERGQGMPLVSVIEKPINKRTASIVRHNRAHGFHDVDLMSNIVKELHESGHSDVWVTRHLGMDRGEILHLEQVTDLAALFRDIKFDKA